MTSTSAIPLRDLRLRPGPFADAAQRGLRTVLALDPDRLLSPFRREAGLAHAPGYGGWESEGLDGHILGHTLSALAFHAAAGSVDARSRLDELLRGLRECQIAAGTGYLGGVPDGARLWSELEDRIDADTFHLNGRWVPLYNLHKTLTGLVDAVEHTQDALADVILSELTHWWLRVLKAPPAGGLERILTTEFGGLTATFARLALLRRDSHLLDVARSFAHRALLVPLAEGRDELDGLHANTQIPVVVGYAVIARAARELGGEGEPFARAARTFWKSVVERRSVAIGGNSIREHFPAASHFGEMFTAREGPETCNTYNMVQLAHELRLLDGDDRTLEFAERALSNHLLSAQHPDHGGFVYFTAQRPGHYRVASGPESGFWCCVGTGLEMHARHAAAAFSESRSADAPELHVDIVMAAQVQWGTAVLTVETGRPVTDAARLTIDVDEPRRFVLSIRIPDSVDGGAVAVTDDGETIRTRAGDRLRIDRVWSGRTVVELALPPRLHVEPAPDGSAWGWVVDGPRVLAERIPDDALEYRAPATRMGHIARGPLRPLAEATILDPSALEPVTRLGEGAVQVRTADGRRLALEPFALLHDARYSLGFPLAATGSVDRRRHELTATDERSLAWDLRTRDRVRFGEQQPESDHATTWTAGTSTGRDGADAWRRTSGRIAFMLRDWTATATTLRVEWLAAPDDGSFAVEVAGSAVVPSLRSAGVADIDLAPLTDGRIDWPVTLVAAHGATTPRFTTAWLLSDAADGPG